MNALNTVRAIAPACVSKEFSAWATGKTSPVVEWCKALARHEHERCGGPGVGVVGMCFTGNFALAMLPDTAVIAPVLSQPSLPLGLSKKAKAGLYLSDVDLAKVQERMAGEPDLCVLGLRFSNDKLVPPERFAHLREALGDRFVAVEIDSSPGNPHGNPRTAHSVLTMHLVDEPGHPTRDALEQVLDLFRTKLLTPA
jgi:dienelactone hydrolase